MRRVGSESVGSASVCLLGLALAACVPAVDATHDSAVVVDSVQRSPDTGPWRQYVVQHERARFRLRASQ